MYNARSRTNIHYLVFHLTIADTLVSFVTMPLEAAWRFTQQVANISLRLYKDTKKTSDILTLFPDKVSKEKSWF